LVVLGLLAGVVTVSVVFPFFMTGVAVARGIASGRTGASLAAVRVDAESGALLLRTLRTAVAIGAISTVLAWPVAWAFRSRPRAWAGLMLAPMLMPSYLAYAGWGLLRSPGTWTGDLIATAPPPPWSTEPGYWALLTGDVIAVAGLCLWAWPLAALILSYGFSRLDGSALEALRLEGGPAWRKGLCVLGMVKGAVAIAVLAVALVMLGSAVPLHLAQVRTWAVHLWLLLDQTPVDRHWEVWLGAWPLVLIAVLAGTAIACRATRQAGGSAASSQPLRGPGTSRTTIVLALGLALLSVVMPGVLFGWFVPNLRALHTFWLVHHQPLETGLGLGAAAATTGAAIAGAVWLGLAGGRSVRGIASLCCAALLISGLLPGVFVGSAVASAWNAWDGTRWMGDSAAIVVLGHLARFGFVPAVVGAYLARAEPIDERDSRRLDGAEGLKGWALACLPGGLGTVVAAGLAAGILSFHEIESAVILQPPGLDSFPRQMLGFLHYARTQEVCAGALLIMGVGVLGAGLAVVCDAASGNRRPN
jgi:ABC-type Fe3+ transport system permease subunit